MSTPFEIDIPTMSSGEKAVWFTPDVPFVLESYEPSDANLVQWTGSGSSDFDSSFLPEMELGGSSVSDKPVVVAPSEIKLDPAKSIAEHIEDGVLTPATNEDRSKFHRGDRAAASLYQFSGDISSELGEAGSERGNDRLAEGEAPRIKVVYEDNSFDANSNPPQPDLIVAKDGTIKVLNDPELDRRKEIIIQVAREPGQVGEPTDAQTRSLSTLVDYLTKRIEDQYPAATENGVTIDDKQGLVPQAIKEQAGTVPEPEMALPPPTQQQIQDMNRIGGSGSGSMGPSEARDYFPESEVPRLPSESDQLAALKNVVAGFESRGQKEPYYAVQERGDRGWGVGRYALTSWGFFNWLMGLSDEDLEEIEELEGKDGKGKKRIRKGTAAKLRALRAALKNKGQTEDKDAGEFIDFMKKMNDGTDPISKDEIDKFLPRELQELIAGDQISKFAEQATDPASGKVDIGQVVLGMHLGSFPEEADLARPENQSLMKAAENAFPLAIKTVTDPNAPVEWTESDGKVLGNPNDYFFTQFRNPKFNPNGPGRSNNCGPASLAMAVKAFGKADGDPEALIQKTRVAMTGRNDKSDLTDNGEVLRGAKASGLNGEIISGMNKLDRDLAEGKMIVALGNPSIYGRRLSAAEYSHYNGLHYILVAGTTAGENGEQRYVVNDPLSRKGTITISRNEMSTYFRSGVSVWS